MATPRKTSRARASEKVARQSREESRASESTEEPVESSISSTEAAYAVDETFMPDGEADTSFLEEGAVAPDAAHVVDAAFREDTKIRKKLSEHLSMRARPAALFAQRADEAFEGFKPSRFTQRQREKRNYLAPGENLATATDRLIQRRIEEINQGSDRRSLKLRATESVRDLITEMDGGNGGGTLALAPLLDWLNANLVGPLSLRDEPAYTRCAAEKEAKDRLDRIEGNLLAAPAPPNGSIVVGGGEATVNGEGEPARTMDLVAKHVHTLVAHMPSPEEQPVLTKRPDRAERDLTRAKEGIDTFELRSGPSDVTSYHDFNSLQIAFEHVWAEVFDARLGQLGRELYETLIELVDFTKYAADPAKSVTSIEDIKELMDHARELGRVVDDATPTNALLQGLMSALDSVRATLIQVIGSLVEYDKSEVPSAVDGILGPLREQIQLSQSTTPGDKLSRALPAVGRLTKLLTELDSLLKQPYAFTVFAKNSCNFGIMVTYRQKWVPERYQVGDLVSTIPLAPRETWRYTTKQVTKKSRTTKELENNLRTNRTEADTTSRTDREIVARAENATNFKMTADGSFGTEANKIHATGEAGGNAAKISQDTKKNFREAVLKSAQEYKHDNKMELETITSDETEATTYHEIQNPNDELTVTYLFYELQRTYRISEKIHQVTPVVLVANEMPAPNEIDDAWLMEHDWILRRVLLDDSFRPALDYLTRSFVGDELNLQILDNNAQAQRQVVEDVKAQVAAQLSIVEAAQRNLSQKIDAKAGLQFTEGFLKTVKSVFDPFKLTGQDVTGTGQGMDTIADYAQETLDRAEREKMRLLDQLSAASSSLQVAVDKLSAAITEHYNRVNEIDRLRVHVKENILYYMQAIWNHEPPDQRYFRVFQQVKVPIVKPNLMNVTVPVGAGPWRVDSALLEEETLQVELPPIDVDVKWKRLVEVADLDEVLGYKGNYAIYRLKENNYLTLHMMLDYLELADEIEIRDPDDFANYTVEDLQKLAACLYEANEGVYAERRDDIKKLIIDRLISGRAEDDRVIVPTKSLYIEALVGTHPLLEDFKLLHRGLDVKKVQGEVRHAELENVRLAARVLKGKDEDPDIERKIVIEGETEGFLVQPEG